MRPWSSQQALRRKNTHVSFEQRRVLIHRTIEFADGRVPVMVGISHPSFRLRSSSHTKQKSLRVSPRCNCLRRCGRLLAHQARPTS